MWTIRAHQWWNSKVPIALASAYHLGQLRTSTLAGLQGPLLLLLLGGITAGCFASVVNDTMDLALDGKAGKVTGIMTYTARQRQLWMLLACIGVLAETALLSHYPCAQLLFVLVWMVHLAYTSPPIRLKERGAFGVFCVAAGEHGLATLFAASLVIESTPGPVPWKLCGILLAWSMALGLRSILWHQLTDWEHDRKSQATTFGQLYQPKVLSFLGAWVVFPAELGSFFWLFPPVDSGNLALLLAFYFAQELFRCRSFGNRLVVVSPASSYRFAMLEFYLIFWPLFSLLQGRAMLLLGVHILLFHQPWATLCKELAHLVRWRLLSSIRARRG